MKEKSSIDLQRPEAELVQQSILNHIYLRKGKAMFSLIRVHEDSRGQVDLSLSKKSTTARLFTCAILFALSLFVLSVSTTRAQDGAPTPTPSAEELKLQEEKKILELKKEIAEAKKAIRDAQPQPSTTALEGNTTLDEGVRLETEMVSYKAMSEAAFRISDEIKKKRGSARNIAIYDAQIVKDWRFYRALQPAFKGQVEDIFNSYVDLVCNDPDVNPQFKKTFCTREDETALKSGNQRAETAKLRAAAVTEAFAVGTNLIKSFVDLAALFRTETKIEGKTVTIDESALVAEIFRALKNDYGAGNINLYYPEVFPPRKNLSDYRSSTVTLIGTLFSFKKEAERLIKKKNKDNGRDTLLAEIKNLSKEKADLEEKLNQIKQLEWQLNNLKAALRKETVSVFRRKLWEEILELQVEREALGDEKKLNENLGKVKAAIKEKQDKVDEIDTATEALAELNARFQSFVDEFIKVDTNGVNALALFIKSEDIENALSDNESYWLEIKSVSAGGNNRIRKNLLWYLAGARVDHSGGIIVEYTLYNKDGSVVYSDKLSYYEGYVEPKKIKSKPISNKKFEDPIVFQP